MHSGNVAAGHLARALDGVVEAALLGGRWDLCLPVFAEAAGAGGATLVREKNRRDISVLPTPSIAESVDTYMRGATPPNPRRAPHLGEAFVTDGDQFPLDEISHHPFYCEFLQPVGFGWHACAVLAETSRDDKLLLSLKRRHADGHYGREHIRLLNAVLPTLRVAADVSRAVLDAEARGAGSLFETRGDLVVMLDRTGRLIGRDEVDSRLLEIGFQVVAGCLSAPEWQQPHLSRAIGMALGDPPRAARAVLGGGEAGERLLVNVLPVVGASREVFAAASAVVAIRALRKPDTAPEDVVATLCAAFDLTRAEARAAALVSAGFSLHESANRLGISTGTIRNYIKSAFRKTHTARQSELAALIGQLQA